MDTNYWTFGDLLDAIPADYYTNPASAFRYQMDKIDWHLKNIPNDAYTPFLHPWYGTGVLASAFGIELICNEKAKKGHLCLRVSDHIKQPTKLPEWVPIPRSAKGHR